MNTNRKVLRRRLRNLIAAHPFLYLPLRRITRPEATLGPDTELIVEGFPRSGNTYAEFALRASQPRPIRIAHHSHAPAQVLAGYKRSIPVILAVREPRASLLSYASRVGHARLLPVEFLLDEYIWYHRSILPTASGVLAVTLDDLIHRFDIVLSELNRRFDLDLRNDEMALHDLETRAVQLMDAQFERRFGRSVSASNPYRDRSDEEEFRDRAKEILDSEPLNARMETAWSLYRQILDKAGVATNC